MRTNRSNDNIGTEGDTCVHKLPTYFGKLNGEVTYRRLYVWPLDNVVETPF